MALEDHPYLNRTDEPVLVSSRLLLLPAFLVVCLTVTGVLYALANTVAKPARPTAPLHKRASAQARDTQVHVAPGASRHTSIPHLLPGEPAVVHHS